MPVLELPALVSWPNAWNVSLVSTPATLNNATDWAATYFRYPRSGNITGISFLTSTVTTGATLIGTLQTPSGTYPNTPSGSLVHANATGTVVVANTDDAVTKRIDFAGNVPVVAGEKSWFKLAVSSGVPSGLIIRMMANNASGLDPYGHKRESSVETYSSLALALIFHYDDGDAVLRQAAPASAAGYHLGASYSPTREVGAKMRLPFSGRCTWGGVRLNNVTTNSDVDVVLYDADDNVLGSVSYLGSDMGGTGALSGMRWVEWPTPIEIQKGEWYRLVAKGQSASTYLNAIPGAIPVGPASATEYLADYHATYRGPAGGTWTDQTNRSVTNFLAFDQIYLPDTSHQF